ncbi:MAG: YeeE/YedE family protein [Alphaproteobacteria bacterium]|nr:YeeE/YedE family protein [Alphaproteobacteria bacterium]
MANFTPVAAIVGGVLVGLAAVLLWLANGRIAGISGIVGGLMTPQRGDLAWRFAFILGLAAGPLLYAGLGGAVPAVEVTPSIPLLVAGGLLVGYGTRLGGGCTSGHGVCGLARLSPRSLAATVTFLVAGLVTVFIARHALGA